MDNKPAKAPAIWEADPPALLAMLLGSIMVTLLMRGQPFLGHDWMFYFVSRVGLDQYPPWIGLLSRGWSWLMPGRESLSLLQGLTTAVPAIYTYSLARRTFPETKWPALAAIMCVLMNPLLPVMWWLGQVEVLAMLGYIIVPWGIPLLFAKPHLAPWALLYKRRTIIYLALFGLISLILWPSWVYDLAAVSEGKRFYHPAGMGWIDIRQYWLLPLGLVMLLLSDRKPMRLIAAGSLITPFLNPYHFFLLLPAFGLLKGGRQAVLWVLGGPLLFMAILTPTLPVKLLLYLFPLCVWFFLADDPDPRAMWADPDSIAQRLMRTAREALAIRSWADVKDFILKDEPKPAKQAQP